MRFFKSILGTLILCLLFPLGAEAQPEIGAPAALLMERTTGQVLWSKNPHQLWPPASTTKILTALVALEKGKLDDVITVGPNPPQLEGTMVYLKEGERATLEDLLYALMLNSANDAALAIAEHYGGTEEGFVGLMNEKARSLGALSSTFVNPHGLPHPGHLVTAHDLALITRAALENPTFRMLVRTRTRIWQREEGLTELVNLNRLLWDYPGAQGVKTGYTSASGYNLVAYAQRGDQEYIAVVLGEPSARAAQREAARLLDYGFDNFQVCTLVRRGERVGSCRWQGETVDLVAAGDLTLVLPREAPLPTARLKLHPFRPPLPAGRPIGELIYMQGDEVLGRVEVVNAQPLLFPDLLLWMGGLLGIGAFILYLRSWTKCFRRSA